MSKKNTITDAMSDEIARLRSHLHLIKPVEAAPRAHERDCATGASAAPVGARPAREAKP